MNKATALYIPHGGGPLPLLNEGAYVAMNRFLREFPQSITKPDAVIVISAHWEEEVVSVIAGPNPELLFDYYGFPAESYEYRYPAPGQPQLAQKIQALLGGSGIECNLNFDRGFDHGLFVPLMLMYPDGDIPCVQLSLSSSLDAALHINIGKALAGLKGENILILGSGFSFHNMRALMSKTDDSVDEKNQAFESWLAQTCSDTDLSEDEREQSLANWLEAPHARYCHPREEHLLPLQVCYGFAQSPAQTLFQQPVARFIASAYRW
ncbi:MAG: 4,5-DOPA dioxygenase extradiol [Planctomycetota bacterium]|jgi:4,5-DOPA dioxygenase extradiol